MTDTFDKFLQGIHNVSGFDGTIESDFLKLARVPDGSKKNLIDYNLNSFEEYRTALNNYLKSVYPLDYNNFASSDLGQMLVELFAYLASTLTLRADMTANEMYIDTVKDRGNLQRLLQLIGVSMRGPTASKATGKLTVDIVPGGAVTILEANRRLTMQTGRNNSSLTYTIYRQNANGTLDLASQDLVIPLVDFASTTTVSNLLLLEGALKATSGKFLTGVTRQTIEISDGPIVEGSLSVSSDEGSGTIYDEIFKLFAASGGAHNVFEKTYTNNYGVILAFGDGHRGKLPSPDANYIATYRIGGGANGNIIRGGLNAAIPVMIGANTIGAKIENITKATGGNEAESVEHAKRYAPYFFKTQYRAVTGEDYHSLANAFIGTTGQTAKAMVSLRKNGASANIIDLYILAKASSLQLERASVAFKKELLDYFQTYKMLTDEIVVSDGVVRTVDLVATIFVDKANLPFVETVKQKAAKKLVEFFSTDNREFGQKLSMAELVNFMLTVPEVRFFRVENIDQDVFVNFNEIVQLNNFEFTFEIV